MKHSLLDYVGRHARLTLVVVFAITAFFLYHASFLTLDAEIGRASCRERV